MKVIDAVQTGQKIKAMCEAKGLSVRQIQAALQLGTTQSIYKWFSKKSGNIPSVDHLVMLADLLECELSDLIVLQEIPRDY